MNIKQSIGLSSLLLTSVMAHAGVSGTVFKDIPLNGSTPNTYGVKDTNDIGLSGVTVTAYPSKETTTTAADGTWSLNTTGKVKIEFTNLPQGLKESQGESSVQFVNGDSSSVDLALYNPAEYVTGSVDMAMAIQANSALAGQSIVSLKILDKDSIPTTGENDTIPTTTDIPFSKLGTIWGVAYDSTNNDLYASASLRRYGAMGPEGLGAIYKIRDGNVELFTMVEGVGSATDNADRNLSVDPDQPSHDPIFDEVGRVGLGDIDMSEDGTKLYVVNLNSNALVEIDMATKAQKAYDIGNPFGAGCSDNDIKSWGIGQKDGEVYVGSVCTTDTAQGAYISKLEGSTFKAFHQIPLDMDGENSLYSLHTGKTNGGKRWRTWITNSSDLFEQGTDEKYGERASLPAPILSDIIFDENKGMILGFLDRTSLQSGVGNYSPDINDDKLYIYDAAGDIYRVCNVNGSYKNEGSEGCPLNDTAGHEYFTEEEWKRSESEGRHNETALGGLSYLQGSGVVASAAFDPAETSENKYDSSGVIWMSRDSGTKLASQLMVGGPGLVKYNGKAGGMGDLELLTPAAPTEIGDRVWLDSNGDCIQNANEAGISGVKVDLYDGAKCEGSSVGTATTDANGNYRFDVDAAKTYSVCINGAAEQNPLKDTKLTCSTAGTTINNSDASLDGNDAKVAVAPLTTGGNDHSFDFGFAPLKADPTPVVDPRTPPAPVEPDSCDCQDYEESSAPALNGLGMIGLIFLTSFVAFLFRRELNEGAN